MTIFKGLQKKYDLKKVQTKSKKVVVRPICNPTTISKFMDYWEDSDRHSWPDQPWYTGTGLHYNPNCEIRPLTKQLCGNPTMRPDYMDTMGYDREISPGLLDQFGPFPAVRCKITCLSASSLNGIMRGHVDWHRDESPYEVLRVIIPLKSDLTYLFQLDNSAPISLIPGHAYAFDQSMYHRVFSNGPSNLDRIHLILSFVTWFNRTNDGWEPNPFCGKVHPLDLFDLIDL